MFKKILLALHDREAMGDTLEKAALLEHYSGAAVTVVQTCWDATSEESAKRFPQEEIDTITSRMKQAELNTLSASIAHYQERIADLQGHVIWSKHHGDAIARYAIEIGADLIITPRHEQNLLQRVTLAEELKLAAHSHTPLLVSSGITWSSRANVITALDVANVEHAELNEALVRFSQELATVLGGGLHLLTAVPTSASSAVPLETLEDFFSRSEQGSRDALQAFADSHPYDYAGVHAIAAPVGDALRTLASEQDAQIAVIGTAARSGIERIFVGNTAEALMQRLTDMDLVMIPAK